MEMTVWQYRWPDDSRRCRTKFGEPFYLCNFADTDSIFAMYNLLFVLIVAAFLGVLFLNIFFRVKVLKHYKYLVQNEVNFTSRHFFDEARMRKEVLEKYPEHETQILEFVGLIKRSMTMASILILIIIGLGYLLFKTR